MLSDRGNGLHVGQNDVPGTVASRNKPAAGSIVADRVPVSLADSIQTCYSIKGMASGPLTKLTLSKGGING